MNRFDFAAGIKSKVAWIEKAPEIFIGSRWIIRPSTIPKSDWVVNINGDTFLEQHAWPNEFVVVASPPGFPTAEFVHVWADSVLRLLSTPKITNHYQRID